MPRSNSYARPQLTHVMSAPGNQLRLPARVTCIAVIATPATPAATVGIGRSGICCRGSRACGQPHVPAALSWLPHARRKGIHKQRLGVLTGQWRAALRAAK